MSHFPGLVPFDTLRTYAATGGHITTTWFATAAAVEEVSAWYGQRLPDHERKAGGDWTRVEIADGLRHFHAVTVHPPEAPAAGPRPSQPPPPGTRTVVRDDTGTFPTAGPPPAAPAPRPSLLRRIRAWLR
ncbi:hypothetical protein OHA72_25460 [Dactylosporangium sp. NBC_01737]|uniref:hypothetical protein n=1 Tax=Dactylosporangium sp. NBC_01737 TaxID=2975959 RepID=UPI002E1515E6|nr:hypothetical protein OHA72_25460 [Dactylosporangium sp. NBC_01737]